MTPTSPFGLSLTISGEKNNFSLKSTSSKGPIITYGLVSFLKVLSTSSGLCGVKAWLSISGLCEIRNRLYSEESHTVNIHLKFLNYILSIIYAKQKK